MKHIPFLQAQFITSAVTHEHFPSLVAADGKPLPEIAVVGRSNVGKSSLINSLLRNKKTAKTSSTPGKTQMLNFFTIDSQLGLVDLPGYGFAKVSGHMRKQWADSIDAYLENRTSLKLILFLIDSRRIPQEEDCALVKWAAFNQKPLLLIFTKTDKLNANERKKNTEFSLQTFKNDLPDAPIPFLHYSIKDPHARIELIDQINALLK